MKAAHLARNLTFAEQFAGARVGRLHEELGAERVETIRSAVKTDWIPIEVDIALSRAVELVCGPGSDRERARESTRESMNARLLRPFVDGVQKLFGLNPESVLKVSPRAWSTVYRSCGSARAQHLDGQQAALDFEHMPSLLLSQPLYLSSIAGGLHAILDLCRVNGDVKPVRPDPGAGTMRFLFTWT